jgi:GH24 family phage-related lysozyme (muramidase)
MLREMKNVNQDKFDALVSLIYSVGHSEFEKSDLRKRWPKASNDEIEKMWRNMKIGYEH